jgi:hypothetical protein
MGRENYPVKTAGLPAPITAWELEEGEWFELIDEKKRAPKAAGARRTCWWKSCPPPTPPI